MARWVQLSLPQAPHQTPEVLLQVLLELHAACWRAAHLSAHQLRPFEVPAASQVLVMVAA